MLPKQADPPQKEPVHGQRRAVIDAVLPAVDGGRFAVKCVAGEPFEVQAHAFADGHDALRVVLRWCGPAGDDAVHELDMVPQGNDVWLATFTPPAPGRYVYMVQAWVDHFLSWRMALARRVEEGDIRLAMRIGADRLDEASQRASLPDDSSQADRLYLLKHAIYWRKQAADSQADAIFLKALALDEAVAAIARRYPHRQHATEGAQPMPLVADRARARFSTWYELFPRSAGTRLGQHGTLADVIARLPYVAAMGFDVLYLPPIHPIGRDKRKGCNNAPIAKPDDVGSPWAIGAAEGGHEALHPQLGSMQDFHDLVTQAARQGMEIALDIAFQCAPDHPWVKAHPAWFRWRPDGSVQYAENPPKQYQDIYPFDFETEDWPALWQALKGIFMFWIDAGVRIFRVDNPHTKSFAFWEWAIHEIKAGHPDVLFLAEAFTRPKVMHRLAKLGFSQSYTYFTWRQTSEEIQAYFTELAHGPGHAYFRPNIWPNTPDILHAQLHHAGRGAFAIRLLLAATLSSSYGIYGPAYELMANEPRSPGSEEYLDSEKYQLRHWGELALERADSLAGFIARVNHIRHASPALQSMAGLCFHVTDNKQLLAYTRRTPDDSQVLLLIVNLDPLHVQSGWLTLAPSDLGVAADAAFEVHDLLGGQRFTWQGARHFILLDPAKAPAHVLQVGCAARAAQP